MNSIFQQESSLFSFVRINLSNLSNLVCHSSRLRPSSIRSRIILFFLSLTSSTSSARFVIWSTFRFRQFCAAILFFPLLLISLLVFIWSSVSWLLTNMLLKSSMEQLMIRSAVNGIPSSWIIFSSRDFLPPPPPPLPQDPELSETEPRNKTI